MQIRIHMCAHTSTMCIRASAHSSVCVVCVCAHVHAQGTSPVHAARAYRCVAVRTCTSVSEGGECVRASMFASACSRMAHVLGDARGPAGACVYSCVHVRIGNTHDACAHPDGRGSAIARVLVRGLAPRMTHVRCLGCAGVPLRLHSCLYSCLHACVLGRVRACV
jgi:hypothetical protein